jgi:hypothetical protein
MKLAFLFSLLIAYAFSKIIEVKSDNYLDFSRNLLKSEQQTLIVFSERKNLCPECHNYLMKDFFKLNDYLKESSKATLAHIDCAYEFLICRKFHV